MASFFRISGVANKLRYAGGKAKHWMKHHPIAANSFLCLNLWVAGDVLAQYSEHRILEDDQDETSKHDLELDLLRTSQCASYGATITGPILAFWYPFLERMSKQHNLAARFGVWGAPAIKVLADQIILDPPLLLMFFSYMNLCEGGDKESLKHKLRSEFLNSYLMSWMTWPIILMGTFRYLPIYAQAPLINFCCIAWDGFLSHRNAVSKHEQALQERKNKRKNDEGTTMQMLHLEDAREFVQEKKGELRGELQAIGGAIKSGNSGTTVIASSPETQSR